VKRSLALLVVAAVAIGGCGGKKSTGGNGPPPEITGIAAVPANAEVVIAVDVPRVIDSPLVQRAVERLLLGSPDLAARWQQLHDSCKLDFPKQVKRMVVAIGPHTGPKPGTGPVLIVATGQFVEGTFVACVRAMLGKGDSSVAAKPVGAGTLYHATDGNRSMWFGFGRSDTVVLGSDEQYTTDALLPGKKLLDNPEMKTWMGFADQNAPAWAVGRADERVRAGLVKATAGELSAGPAGLVLTADATSGLKVELQAIMATDPDAKTLESFAKSQLGLMGAAAQVKSLGKIVDKVAISSDHNRVHLKVELDLDDINQLISVLDGGASSAQDSPPAASGSGSAQ